MWGQELSKALRGGEALTQVLALALAEGRPHRSFVHGLHVLHRRVARGPAGPASGGCPRPAPQQQQQQQQRRQGRQSPPHGVRGRAAGRNREEPSNQPLRGFAPGPGTPQKIRMEVLYTSNARRVRDSESHPEAPASPPGTLHPHARPPGPSPLDFSRPQASGLAARPPCGAGI